MAKSASTACLRCREQKLKCSREKPVCQRCSRLKAKCGYPDPPDRKALAKSRAQQKKRQRVQESNHGSDGSDQLVTPSDREMDDESRYHSGSASIVSPVVQSLHETIGLACQRQLVDAYFDNIWNAQIFFHKIKFLEDLEQGNIPRYLILAICAVATQHLQSRLGEENDRAHILGDYPDLCRQGRQWAEIAGAEVLSGIDQPTISRVQACNVLDLYWLAAGQPERSMMFSNIAFVAASTWNLERISSERRSSQAATHDHFWWQSDVELRRRCFWIVWVGNSIKADQQSVATFSKDRLLKLPLPRDNESFSAKTAYEDIDLSIVYEGQETVHTQHHNQSGLFVELIQLTVIWTWIGSYLESRRSHSARQSLPTLMDIDQSLSKWMKYLPSSAQYSRRNLYEHLVIKQQPQYVWIHCLYHQCRLVLRSSLVPQFSGMTWSGEHHVEAIGVSARIALKTACAISDMASDLIAIECNFGQLPPFVGYCMYASAAIHILFLFSRNVELSNTARTKLSSNIKVLEAMKEHWQSLQRLWARVTTLYEIQVSKGHDAPMLDSDIITGLPSGDHSMGDVNERAQQERDTGRLEEPLAKSMLTFNLRLPWRKIDEMSLRHLTTQETFPDPLSHMMNRSTPTNTIKSLNLSSASSERGGSQLSYPISSNSFVQLGGRINDQHTSVTDSSTVPFSTNIEPSGAVNIDTAVLPQRDFDQSIAALPPNTEIDNLSSFMVQEEGDWWNIDFDELNQTMLALGDTMDFDRDKFSGSYL